MITTRLTERFGIRHPIVCAPMAFVAGGALAAAVSRAGGLGIVAGGFAGTMSGECEKCEFPRDDYWAIGLQRFAKGKHIVELNLGRDIDQLIFLDYACPGSAREAQSCIDLSPLCHDRVSARLGLCSYDGRLQHLNAGVPAISHLRLGLRKQNLVIDHHDPRIVAPHFRGSMMDPMTPNDCAFEQSQEIRRRETHPNQNQRNRYAVARWKLASCGQTQFRGQVKVGTGFRVCVRTRFPNSVPPGTAENSPGRSPG